MTRVPEWKDPIDAVNDLYLRVQKLEQRTTNPGNFSVGIQIHADPDPPSDPSAKPLWLDLDEEC